jgi:hypothetical protein
MRLLKTENIELEESFDHRIPDRYAILPHRWEQDELLYHDLQTRRNRDGAGFIKVQKYCKKGLEDGFEWL